jgi:hypothetical protein
LYEIQQQQQQQQQIKLLQTFPQEHPSGYFDPISCLLQLNPNTLISSSGSSFPSYWFDSVIVIWSKSKSSSLYEPIQRITPKEAGKKVDNLVLLNQKKEEEEEEVFASCSLPYDLGTQSITIWTRKGKGEGEFQIKQRIINVYCVSELLYISHTNELISGSHSFPSLLQIWSPISSSSSDLNFVEKQKIQTSSRIYSLRQINEYKNNDSKRIKFASSHGNGQVMIWSKQHQPQQQINESNHYSLIRRLELFRNIVNDLIFISDEFSEFNHFLIACCPKENKIKILKEEGEEEEVLEHTGVTSLISMSNGQFASGGDKGSLNIWSPSCSP